MTGFAIKTITLTKQRLTVQLTLSIKSLNSRFLETTCKVPNALYHLETDFIKRFKEELLRGYVLFTVHINNPSFFKGPVSVEMNTAQSYLAAIKTLQDQCSIQGNITINDIITLPSVFSIEEQGISEPEKNSILKAVDELLQDLIKVRTNEGKALYEDLQKRCVNVDVEINNIEREAERTMKERKAKILEKINLLNAQQGNETSETQRISLYFDLDKIDIHEEITRFKNHIKTFKSCLESPEQEKGRRLDFTLQELAREVNTIAAKCSDSTISSHAINIKVELEKAREQVQNIV